MNDIMCLLSFDTNDTNNHINHWKICGKVLFFCLFVSAGLSAVILCFRNDAHRLLCVNHVNGHLRAFCFCFSAFNLLLFWIDDPKKLTAMSYNEQKRKKKNKPHTHTRMEQSIEDGKDECHVWKYAHHLSCMWVQYTQTHAHKEPFGEYYVDAAAVL